MKEDTTKICDKCRRALDKAHSTSGRLQSKKDKDDYFPRAGEQNQLLSVSMSMEDPENFVDHVHLIDCQPRQVGRSNAAREFFAALEAQGKRVVVIGMDSPRPPLLGALMAPIGDPEMDRADAFRSLHPHLLKATEPTFLERPSAGKAMLHFGSNGEMALLDYKMQSSLGRMFPMEESKDAMFDRFMKSMMMPSREWLDPIPTEVEKPDWREDRMAFLNGIAGKKKHQK